MPARKLFTSALIHRSVARMKLHILFTPAGLHAAEISAVSERRGDIRFHATPESRPPFAIGQFLS
jgi:hypothetical protein